MTLNAHHQALLEARGLDVELAERFGWSSSTKGRDWIEIPYIQDGRRVNTKFRTLGATKRFSQDPNGTKTYWNVDILADETLKNQPLIVTEGEMDALVAIQCGFVRAVSVPDGAPPEAVGAYDAGAKYSYVRDTKARLAGCKEIILAVDGDRTGVNLLNDLALRFGKARCKWLEYPEGCKDLNDILMKYGPSTVVEVIQRAKWIRVEGLFRMSEMPPINPAVPYSTGIAGMDKHWKIRLGDFTVLSGVPGHGKALAIDTRLPTPSGWVTMAEVKVGDVLIDERGMPCFVKNTTPQMVGRPCYAVQFSDGSQIVADAEHQWLTISEKARRSARIAREKRGDREWTKCKGTDQRHKRTFPSVVTTQQIACSLRSQGKWNHQVQNAAPLVLAEQRLLVDPYVLGVWLGDGTSENGSLACHEQAILFAVHFAGYEISRHAARGSFTIRGLKPNLRLLCVLGNKHIPPIYLRSCLAQRLALLRGLMDTDGNCAKDGTCEFTTTSPCLAEGFYELLCSLGLRASRMEGRATLYGKDCGTKYRFQFTPPFAAFTLSRKLERQNHAGQHHRRTSFRTIVACDPIPSVAVRCVEVDSPSHLYLAGQSMVPTHNSSFANEVMSRMADAYGWRTAVAAFETNPQIDHRRMLRTFYNRKPAKFQDAAEIDAADQWIDEHFLFCMPNEDEDCTLAWLLEKAEACAAQYGAQMLIVDPFNEMDHDRPQDMSLVEYTGFAIKQFKKLARRMNMHVLVVAHPTKLARDKEGKTPIPSLYDIADAAHWANKPDAGIIIHRTDQTRTLIRIQKTRYHDEIGEPGDLQAMFLRDQARFEIIDPAALI